MEAIIVLNHGERFFTEDDYILVDKKVVRKVLEKKKWSYDFVENVTKGKITKRLLNEIEDDIKIRPSSVKELAIVLQKNIETLIDQDWLHQPYAPKQVKEAVTNFKKPQTGSALAEEAMEGDETGYENIPSPRPGNNFNESFIDHKYDDIPF